MNPARTSRDDPASIILKRGDPYQLNLCKTTTLQKTKVGFQDQLLFNAGQTYCRMLAILLTFIKLPFVIEIFVLSIRFSHNQKQIFVSSEVKKKFFQFNFCMHFYISYT